MDAPLIDFATASKAVEDRRYKPDSSGSTPLQTPEQKRTARSARNQPLPTAENFRGQLDKTGTPFDPEKHYFSSVKGRPPIHNTTGKWYRKGAFDHRKKKGGQVETSEPPPTNQGGPTIHDPTKAQAEAEYHREQIRAEEQAKIEAQAVGQVAAQMTFALGYMIGGDEWKPRIEQGFNEQEHITKLYQDYFESQGINDLPPGAALSIGLMGYALPRLTQPRTQGTIQTVKNWFKSKWFAFQAWRSKGKEAEPGEQ